jgi:hypothetical protein
MDGRVKPGHDGMFYQHIVYDCGAAAIFDAANSTRAKKIFADYQP